MPEEASLTLHLDSELRDRIVAEAEATDVPVSRIVGALLRDYLDKKRSVHDAWFRDAVAEGLREADSPSTRMISHDEVMAEWHAERDELLKALGKND